MNNSTKHIRIVLSEMARAALLVLLLYGGAVVVRKVISEHMRFVVDDAPEMMIGISTHEVLGIEGGRFQTVYKPESMHLHDALSTSDPVILAKDNSNNKGRENSG